MRAYIDDLNKKIQIVFESISALEEKLAPVCRSGVGVATAASLNGEKPNISELSSLILTQVSLVQELSDRIASLTSRIDI
jgi:hypothetical protein